MHGKLEVHGTAMGSFEAEMALCSSGAEEHFYGATMVSAERDTEVRIAVDPIAGAAVRVRRSDAPQMALLLNQKNCSVFQVGIGHGNWYVNDVREVRGAAVLDCALETGGTVAAKLEFRSCHE